MWYSSKQDGSRSDSGRGAPGGDDAAWGRPTHRQGVKGVMHAVMEERQTTCPHCGERLLKWQVPDGASWEEEYFLVCFNDECSYYTEGWKWMREMYRQEASYRYAYSPDRDASLMIPVWSDRATREMIVEDDEEGSET